jgi:hypothetical protein
MPRVKSSLRVAKLWTITMTIVSLRTKLKLIVGAAALSVASASAGYWYAEEYSVNARMLRFAELQRVETLSAAHEAKAREDRPEREQCYAAQQMVRHHRVEGIPLRVGVLIELDPVDAECRRRFSITVLD